MLRRRYDIVAFLGDVCATVAGLLVVEASGGRNEWIVFIGAAVVVGVRCTGAVVTAIRISILKYIKEIITIRIITILS